MYDKDKLITQEETVIYNLTIYLRGLCLVQMTATIKTDEKKVVILIKSLTSTWDVLKPCTRRTQNTTQHEA